MYVLIRDLYAKLLLESIDEKFRNDNEELLENMDNILEKDLHQFIDELIDGNKLKEDVDILDSFKSEIYTFKKHNIYLNTLLDNITQHYLMNNIENKS